MDQIRHHIAGATVLAQIPFAKSGEDVVGTVTLVIEAVQVLVLIGSVILVEKALKRTFDENGNRRG